MQWMRGSADSLDSTEALQDVYFDRSAQSYVDGQAAASDGQNTARVVAETLQRVFEQDAPGALALLAPLAGDDHVLPRWRLTAIRRARTRLSGRYCDVRSRPCRHGFVCNWRIVWSAGGDLYVQAVTEFAGMKSREAGVETALRIYEEALSGATAAGKAALLLEIAKSRYIAGEIQVARTAFEGIGGSTSASPAVRRRALQELQKVYRVATSAGELAGAGGEAVPEDGAHRLLRENLTAIGAGAGTGVASLIERVRTVKPAMTDRKLRLALAELLDADGQFELAASECTELLEDKATLSHERALAALSVQRSLRRRGLVEDAVQAALALQQDHPAELEIRARSLDLLRNDTEPGNLTLPAVHLAAVRTLRATLLDVAAGPHPDDAALAKALLVLKTGCGCESEQ